MLNIITTDVWITYIISVLIVVLSPGPTLLTIFRYIMSLGRGIAFTCWIAVFVADIVTLTLSLTSVGALIKESPILFMIIKSIGALFLIYLGINGLKKHIDKFDSQQYHIASSDKFHIFKNIFLVTISNPKAIVFFVAFIPQFVDINHDISIQLLLLGVAFIVIASCSVILWLCSFVFIRHKIQNPTILNVINKSASFVLIVAGVYTICDSLIGLM